MITVEFERAYMPADADPDLKYGAWDYDCWDDFETHVRDMRDEGHSFEVIRTGSKPFLRFFIRP